MTDSSRTVVMNEASNIIRTLDRAGVERLTQSDGMYHNNALLIGKWSEAPFFYLFTLQLE